MKACLLLLVLLAWLGAGHIYSSTPKVTYNYDGYPQYYSLFLSLETGIGADDYLKIVWPEQLYTTAKSEIIVNLISFSNNLQVATTLGAIDSASSTILHATFGYAMQANTWY